VRKVILFTTTILKIIKTSTTKENTRAIQFLKKRQNLVE
jgi:hypothetical protein